MEQEMDIKSLFLPELTEALTARGEKAFRASQVYAWIHQKQAADIDEMTNLSKELRHTLRQQGGWFVLEQVQVQTSKKDGTRKYLFKLPDGNLVESVFMKYHHGNSVCISSQVGCRMGCRFCASTIGGLTRNLTASEMLEQVYAIARDTGERISNLVVMGMGEPFDNYDNLIRFIRLITSPEGMNMSQRNITVSTCGLVPEMKKFADQKLQVTLAVSLHAATDEKRKKIMPVAQKYTLTEIIKACRYYFKKTGRRISFEYSLIRGVNDRSEDAAELGTLLSGFSCHVNLIPVNPVKEREFKRSEKKEIEFFKNKLEKYGINVTIRREMGQDIDGACGQLRKQFSDHNKPT